MVPVRNFVFLLLAVSHWGGLQAQDITVVDYDRATVLARMIKFEKWAWGLEFHVDEYVAGQESKPYCMAKASVSKNGQFVSSSYENFVYENGNRNLIRQSSGFTDQYKGWSFSAGKNLRMTDDEPEPIPSGSVTFLEPNTPALASSLVALPLLGVLDNQWLSEFVTQSELAPIEETYGGELYRGVVCKHPKFADCKLLFDDAGLLSYLVKLTKPGDTVPSAHGNKYTSDIICPDDQSSEITYGPIEYGDLEGRLIVTKCEMTAKAQTPAPIKRRGGYAFSMHQAADSMPTKIDFPQFEWLVDGFPLTCDGNSNIDCEVRNGEVVILVDRSSVDAARRSRMGQKSGWRRLAWNTFLGITGLGIFVFLVWYRNGGN